MVNIIEFSHYKALSNFSWPFKLKGFSVLFFSFLFSFFSAVLCAILFLGVQSILLAGWISFYFKHKNLKDSNDFNQNNRGHEPYRDFDPYLSTIFRSKKESPISSPEPSLDLVQRKLILTHLDDKKQRRRS